MFGAMLGALAGGALNLIGGKQANAANAKMAANQMAFQQGQMDQSQDFSREMVGRQEQFQTNSAKTAMDFAERMSGTAYQRGMADMKEAGLNPMLAYGQGGATAPQGSAPSGASASVGMGGGASATMQNTIGPALGSALQGAKVVTELEQLAANVKQTEAQTALLGDQQTQVRANTGLQIAQSITEGIRPEQIRAGIGLTRAQTGLTGAQTGRTIAETETERERPALVREQTRREGAGANNTILDTEASRLFGRRGAGPAEQAATTSRSIGEAFNRDILERLRALLQ